MAGAKTEGSLSSAILWDDQQVSFKDFGSKYSLPNLVRVTNGQYRNIGVGKSMHTDLYLHSITISSKVLAQSVKLKEGKRAAVSDQKYSLPFTYQGWFEVLSEDGKSIRAMQSIQDLVRLFPPTCLVRDNIKGYIPRESGDLGMDRMRTVHSGELLTLVGEMSIPVQSGKSTNKRRVLRCLDANGDNVYFGIEQKGLFSPVAGQTNISGVHTIRGLLEKFHLPFMVRLVHGIIPTKLEKNFTGVFRMSSVYSDETAFVLPLNNEGKMLPISTREPLKVVAAENFDSLDDHEEFIQIQQKCNKMISSYQNSIHVLYSMPEPEVLMRGRQELMKNVRKKHGPEEASGSLPKQEEDILFLEVEDIYHYVRDPGPVPPPPRGRPAPASPHSSQPPPKQSSRKMNLFGGSKKRHPENVPEDVPSPTQNSPSPIQHRASMPKKVATSPVEVVAVPEFQDHRPPHKDDDYWEEPMYEPLDKIQQKKLHGESAAEPTSQVVPIDKPVENLRQVIKSHHPLLVPPPMRPRTPSPGISPVRGSGTPVRDLEAPHEQGPPPPIPPKNYDIDETEVTLDLTDNASSMVAPRMTEVHKRPISGSPSASLQRPGSNRVHAGMPATEEGMARVHSLANNSALYPKQSVHANQRISPGRTHTLPAQPARVSVNVSNYVQPQPQQIHHPPHVAVARVMHSNGGTHDKQGLRKTDSNGSSRHKVPGMYL